MNDMNGQIRARLEGIAEDKDVLDLAIRAVELCYSGMPETSVAEHLEAVVRKLVKTRGAEK